MKLYHELAEYYFAIESAHRNIYDDVSLIRRFTARQKDPALLDLGCGTGEHLDKVSKLNLRCTGIDKSGNMLAIARKRFPNAGTFIECDMVHLDFYENFTIVVCLFGSFDYILEDQDVDRVFWNTWRSLIPGGIGIFEIWNAKPILRIRNKNLDLVSKSQFGRIQIDRERGFALLEHEKNTIVEVNYRYSIHNGTSTQTLKDRHIMRAYTIDEIEKIVTANGFSITGFYSNASLENYRETSNRIFVIFEKE